MDKFAFLKVFVIIAQDFCGGSSIWLEHSPVTREVAGSSPVHRAKNTAKAVFFKLWKKNKLLCFSSGLEKSEYIASEVSNTSVGAEAA